MQTYISLLRGINVSGQKSIKMEDLREMYESLGYERVKSYIQSGNLIFDTVRNDPAGLEKTLEQSILDSFGFEVPVFVRNLFTMERILEDNPFTGNDSIDQDRLYVTFLSKKPDRKNIPELSNMDLGEEEYQIMDSHIYLHLPGGYARTKLSNNTFERKLKLQATTRNWKTVNKLYEIAAGD